MTDLQSLWFFVPAVIANLVLVTVVNLTAFAVVREREIGTLEQIMVTPIRRLEFILGKTVPFFLIGFLEASLMVRRSLPWEYRRASFGHSAIPALHSGYRPVSFHDLLYPTASEVSGFFFIMPAMVFSGFATPIASMPEVLQWFTYLDPLRYFLVVLRGVCI